MTTLTLLFSTILLLLCLVPLKAEINNFDYFQHGADWQQQAPQGTDWSQCSSEHQQSPIQLSATIPMTTDSYFFSNFYPQKAIIQWLNTTVYIKTASFTTSFGQIYTKTVTGDIVAMRATQVRIRAHAEHKIQGKEYYDLQLQIFCTDLYTSPANDRLALSLMFQASKNNLPDPALQTIIDSYIQPNETTPIPTVNATISFSHLLSLSNEPFSYWYYSGSLTLPPCGRYKSGVNWIIPNKVYSMSQTQKQFFWALFYYEKEGIDGNWRKLQPKGDNKVLYYQG